MIELLTRFVVAVELIAAALTKGAGSAVIGTVVEESDVGRAGSKKEDPTPEKKTTRTRNTKKEEPKGPDIDKLRADIKQAASDIAQGDSDECADKFDDLLEDYGVRNVGKLADDQVEDFYADVKKLASKYYDITE